MVPIDSLILASLRSSAVHLTARDLSQQVGASARTIEHRVDELRGAGFDIEMRPGFGYRLLAAPDRLIADDILSRLGPSELFPQVLVFNETGSTNDLALQFGRQGKPGGLVVFAEKQTSGRGRFGRKWESAANRGLWFSLLLRPEMPSSSWPRLTTWAALGVAAGIEKTARERTFVKWPNDVILRDRKVSGILIEVGTEPSGAPFAVVGIGVNVNHEPSDFPPELEGKAGSIRDATGVEVDRVQLAVEILRELESRYADVREDFSALISEAQNRSLLLGKWVAVHRGGVTLEGLAERLDEQGQLLLRQPDGEIVALNAGEVTLSGR